MVALGCTSDPWIWTSQAKRSLHSSMYSSMFSSVVCTCSLISHTGYLSCRHTHRVMQGEIPMEIGGVAAMQPLPATLGVLAYNNVLFSFLCYLIEAGHSAAH